MKLSQSIFTPQSTGVAVLVALVTIVLSMGRASAQGLPPGTNFNTGLPGAILNHDVQVFNLQRNQPYLNSPINPEGKKTFIPESPEIIYDESLKRHTQIQGQIIGPEPIISAPEN